MGLKTLSETIGILSLIALVLLTLACWFFLFLTAHRHAGVVYGLGHLVTSVFLTPALLLGIILIPLLVRGDIERATTDPSDDGV